MNEDPPTKGAVETQEGGARETDRYLEVLSDGRRRIIIDYLASEEQVDLDELVDYVTSQEATRIDRSQERIREMVTVELTHVHLPKLRDIGLIDRTGETVRYTGTSPLVRDILTALSTYDPAIEARWTDDDI